MNNNVGKSKSCKCLHPILFENGLCPGLMRYPTAAFFGDVIENNFMNALD